MKINRHNLSEKNKTTSFWLHEFAHDLEKNAENLDYLKQYLENRYKTNKYSTIEEKLADIKQRVGFDLARKINDEIEKVSKTKKASCSCESLSTENCHCTVKTAMVHPEKDVKLMGNILKYIEDMATHESNLNSAMVIARCREEDGLRFNDLNIDIDKLKSYIKKLLERHNNEQEEDISYLPKEPISSADADDIEAEYFRHAEPSLF